ncbi:hypothetical protein PR202_gb06794 [Eleusine coracana subsp. coracana]|uniref:Uncharacterized protein n=1 Tax=Eleusine coracana subsp. coracana TaxID=191504 RepID=A0AAV5EAE5_ELECO|nr:hypothetical protein PR202_gb06794 [Eleusine coracana subsp. coracana]
MALVFSKLPHAADAFLRSRRLLPTVRGGGGGVMLLRLLLLLLLRESAVAAARRQASASRPAVAPSSAWNRPSPRREAEWCEGAAQAVLPSGARGGGAAAREPGPETAGGRKVRGEAVPLRLRLGRARRRAGPGTPAPVVEVGGRGGGAGRRRGRSSASASARQLGASLWEIHDAAPEGRRRRRGGKGLASPGREGAAGVDESDQGSAVNQFISPVRSLDIQRFRVPSSSLKTSTELLKVLNRIWSLEEQHTANLSVVNGLRTKLLRKNKEHAKIEGAVHSLQGELADERRLRRHSEELHRKLGKEISEIKSAFLKEVKELEKEKQANHILEELCDQFAMGIRNYEDEVRVVKQRQVKNYELNFDKSVLYIAEAWIDGRVQMQNIDAKEGPAQKAMITERFGSEIQAFLLSKRSGSSKHDEKYRNDNTTLRRQSLESVHLNGATSAPQFAEDDDDGSVASDLHCFELNMHGNGIRNYGHMEHRRSGRTSMDIPKGRSEDIHGITAEGSYKDNTRSNNNNLQHATKRSGIDSHYNAGVTLAEERNGITNTHISRGSHNDSSKNNTEAPHVTCLGQESFDHYSRTSLFCEGTTSGDLGNLGSPTQPLTYQSTSLEPGDIRILTRAASMCGGKHAEGKITTSKARGATCPIEGIRRFLKLKQQEEIKVLPTVAASGILIPTRLIKAVKE